MEAAPPSKKSRRISRKPSRRSPLVGSLDWQRQREYYGGTSTQKDSGLLFGSHIWESSAPSHGGIFGLDFSPDGSVLGVATEQKSVLLFDPLRAAETGRLSPAHSDCVNTVKDSKIDDMLCGFRFLDSRTLASCSDDQSVKLWDLRNYSRPTRTFRAHANWVKNVEFVRERGLILSSAFDGYVYAWDINDPQSEPQRLFYSPGLMRMRLSPDSRKMLLSTQWGYILTIHNLHFDSLPTQLFGFKPNMYWLMLKSGTSFASSAEFLPRFTAARNRTELIMDFPDNCDPDNISSLAPHPSSTCAASRSNNHDEQSEWTCVHDLRVPEQEALDECGEGTSDGAARRHTLTGNEVRLKASPEYQPMRRRSESIITLQMDNDGSADESDVPIFQSGRLSTISTDIRHGSGDSSSGADERQPEASTSQQSPNSGRRRRLSGRRQGTSGVALHLNVRSHQMNAQISVNSAHWGTDPRAFFIRTGPVNSGNRTLIVLGGAATPPPPTLTPIAEGIEDRPERSKSHSPGKADIGYPPVYNRLLHFKEEPRVGRGFIKEQSWSSDGRILASPYGFAIRLLAFDQSAPLMPNFDSPPSQLCEIGSLVQRHESVVLATRFSPTQPLLVSGDHHGRLAFSHPRL